MIDLKILNTVRARLKYRAIQKAKYFQIKLFKSFGKNYYAFLTVPKSLRLLLDDKKPLYKPSGTDVCEKARDKLRKLEAELFVTACLPYSLSYAFNTSGQRSVCHVVALICTLILFSVGLLVPDLDQQYLQLKALKGLNALNL